MPQCEHMAKTSGKDAASWFRCRDQAMRGSKFCEGHDPEVNRVKFDEHMAEERLREERALRSRQFRANALLESMSVEVTDERIAIILKWIDEGYDK